MAFDEGLAQRIREILADRPGVTDRKMFGGLGFMLDGRMAVAATSDGVMLRVDPAEAPALLKQDGIEPMEMRGTKMDGWLLASHEAVEDDDTLRGYVELSASYAESLPPK